MGTKILDMAMIAARRCQKFPLFPRAHLRDGDNARCMMACEGEVTGRSSVPLSNSPGAPLLRESKEHTRLLLWSGSVW